MLENGDNILYMVILLFNFVLNVISAELNSKENICETKSEAVTTQSPDMTLAPLGYERNAALGYPIFCYCYVGLLIILITCICNCKTCSRKSCCGKEGWRRECGVNTEQLLNIAACLILFVGGILYLVGDNILILYGTFDAPVVESDNDSPDSKVDKIKVKDLRSYLVAFALMCMIVNRILPFIGKAIHEISSPPNETLVAKIERDDTSDQRNDCKWVLQALEENNSSCSEGNASDNLDRADTTKSPGIKLDMQIVLHGQVAQVNSLNINAVKDNNINEVNGNTNQGELQVQISKFKVNDEQQAIRKLPTERKSCIGYVLGIYANLLTYALIADALYTTILDEITQQNVTHEHGCVCPEGHVAVAYTIFGCLSVIWLVSVIVLSCTSCCNMSQKYPRIMEDEDWKKVTFLVACKTGREEFRKAYDRGYKSLEEFCENHCCKSITITIFILLTSVQILILVATGTIALLAVAILFSIFLVCPAVSITCCCIIFCRSRRDTSRDNSKLLFCNSNWKALYCTFLSFFIIIWTTLMAVYLPIFLIADNKWPWVCSLSNKSDWTGIKAALNVLNVVITIPLILYQLLRDKVKESDIEASIQTGIQSASNSDGGYHRIEK
jgi:hypothetical protein